MVGINIIILADRGAGVVLVHFEVFEPEVFADVVEVAVAECFAGQDALRVVLDQHFVQQVDRLLVRQVAVVRQYEGRPRFSFLVTNFL